MCGRMNVSDDPLVQELLTQLGIDSGPLPTHHNVAPTEPVPVIFDYENRRELGPMRWWLTPHWSDGPSQKYAMFNARIENVLKSRAFQGPVRYHRGIVPAASFIEWQRRDDGKQAWCIEPREQPMAMAAIWDCWHEELFSCAILTQPASAAFKPIHHRMPLLLQGDEIAAWLDSEQKAEDLVARLRGASIPLRATAIDDSLNNARNKLAPRPLPDVAPLTIDPDPT